MSAQPEITAENRIFEGRQIQAKHASEACACEMTFSIYLPPQAVEGPVPALYWLSGLTCTDQNFVTKAGAQRYAAEHGVAIVAPDTSPRGEGVPDDPEGAYDFGLGAGFYLNATQPPFKTHYGMYDYIVEELPAVVSAAFPIDGERAAISGHSMGGHGALTIGLKNPRRYRSVSAFSPIVAPSRVPWGQKALTGYLGEDRSSWAEYDATELVARATERNPLFVDQGEADDFLETQLKPELLEEACQKAGHPLTLKRRPGYDHSYYYIATFIGEHVAYHADHLRA